jgi:ABC-type glutathione transport system ATPase component
MSHSGEIFERDAAGITASASPSGSQSEVYQDAGVVRAGSDDKTNQFTLRFPTSGQEADVNLQSATPGGESDNKVGSVMSFILRDSDNDPSIQIRPPPKTFTSQPSEPKSSRPSSIVSKPLSVLGYSRAFPLTGIPEVEYPESVFFSWEFQFGLRNGVQIAENSASILEQLLARQNSYKLSGDPTADPIKDLKTASRFEFSSAKTIAFLGNSGEGKSSLINSLLDIPNLAATVRHCVFRW